MTMKDMIIDKARNGGYGFNNEYILLDNAVKHAYRFNFRECVRDAVIRYARWQLDVIENYGFTQEIIDQVCHNVREQLDAYQAFENDWELACLLDDLQWEKYGYGKKLQDYI